METISTIEIIRIWERGAALPPIARALSLLENVYPVETEDNLTSLSIGARDSGLLTLREQLFGSTLESVTECPNCGTAIEFALDTKELHQPVQKDTLPLRLTVGDISLQFRLLNSIDLVAVARCGNVHIARRELAERCVIEATRGGVQIDIGNLPDEVVQALSDELAKADSQANIALDLRCPECADYWLASFDIASFLWTEINVRAKRLLAEVHTLAWTYGWGEADILAMSDARRQFYLGMVQ